MADPIRLGFHVRDKEELDKGVAAGSNVLELKLHHLQLSEFPVIEYGNERWTINHDNAKYIQEHAADCDVQIHVPYEEGTDPKVETGINQLNPRHWVYFKDRFTVYQELKDTYGLGTVVTMHAGLYRVGDTSFVPSEEEAIGTNAKFFENIQAFMRTNGLNFKLDLENTTEPKRQYASLGYTGAQIKDILRNTDDIGITIDTGHRRLVSDLSIADLVSRFQVNCMHFHTNPGVKDYHSWKDDAHQFATPDNLEHFYNYAKAIKRRDIPVICEVNTRGKTVDELKAYREQTIQDIMDQ